MEVIIYIIVVHLNFALIGLILFAKKRIFMDCFIRLGLTLLNIWLIEWTPVFLVLLYFYNGKYIFQETRNLFIVFLLNTFCVNFIGISVFLTIEVPRFLENYDLLANAIL
ncbi:ATP-binding protein, partial [Enterococcus hirae]|nr:ATP-binding protein [Enterococcus hirae]EMF0139767.1 ATP-binding protein [Enterococcus hirae]EMF0506809.1 ATP-binding protein [Enterococcus hirae]